MADYKVSFKPSANRELQKLPAEVQRRVVAKVAALAINPRPAGVVKLAGDENLWRIRIGDYRVIYEFHDDRPVVVVLRVANRRDVYRQKTERQVIMATVYKRTYQVRLPLYRNAVGEVVDFHATLHTCISGIVAGGASVKAA